MKNGVICAVYSPTYTFFLYFCNVKEERIIIALGSNVHSRRNMRVARMLLSELIPGLQFTRNMRTRPIGTESGAMYLNCLCWGSVALSESELRTLLKDVERECGNTIEKRQQGMVEMDVDLLQYGTLRRHEKDWERPYIITLLKEIEQ